MVKHYAHAAPKISYCLPRWLKAGGVSLAGKERMLHISTETNPEEALKTVAHEERSLDELL